MKKSRYATPEHKTSHSKENESANIINPIEEEFEEDNKYEPTQQTFECDLQYLINTPTCVEDPADLTPENITVLEDFINNQRRKISEYNVADLKQIFFVFSILKSGQIISEEIMKLASFYSIEEEILKKALDFDYYKFVLTLLKNTKEYFKAQIRINISGKSSRYSQAQAYRSIAVNSLSLRATGKQKNDNEGEMEFWSEHDRANDYIQKCLSKNQEKAAIKLMNFYYMKFSKNFIKYSILDFAIINKNFYFTKKYFDIYPRTRYKIKDFECITLIIELLDDKDNFMHGIFLLSKVNLLCLNEVYIRLIIDKYQNFIKYKLMLISYSLNPILVCVTIIQNLKRFENNYANLRIKIKTICDEYLNLAKEIVSKINDDTILKTIFLKIFYPSQVSLLKILYEDRNYFSPILQNEILYNIVTDLWSCEYYWTLNFLNSSSILKNLMNYFGGNDQHINPLEERLFMNKMIDHDVFEANRNEEEPETKEDNDSTPMHYLVFPRNIKGEHTISSLKEIDLNEPFSFYKKTKFSRDIQYTNHIFSYYFFDKSPLFKVAFEIFIYSLITIVILINFFSIFRIRKDFDSTPRDILYFSDGLVDLKNSLDTTSQFKAILTNYTSNAQVFDPSFTLAKAYQLIGKDTSSYEKCLTFFPWYRMACKVWGEDCVEIKDVKTQFWILQLYYYLMFFQTVLEIVFVWKVSKRVVITSKNWIDTFLCVLNIYIQSYYFENLHYNSYLLKDNRLEQYRFLEELCAIFIFLIWIKFITYLKLIKQFGTIIKVMEVMMTNLMNFFVIFGIIILAFASICFNLFDQYNASQFGTFWITLRTLVLYLFGQVTFDRFTDHHLLTGFIINFYEIITYILLLNLLIAILSNTFTSYNQKSNLQNASVLYSDYLSKKPDKFYSSLTGICPPFNFYLLAVAPIILMKKSSKINKISVFIGFFMYSIIFFVIYVIVNIGLVLPFCYFRLAITIPKNYIGDQRQTKKGLIVWVMWLFSGPFYMIWIFLKHDLPMFVRSMFFSCSLKDKLDEITKEEIMHLYKKAEEFRKEGEEYVTYHEFITGITDGIEEINRNFRQNSSIQTKNTNWNILENLKDKTSKILGFTSKQEVKNQEKDRENLTERIENKINAFVEIDKMEVFSFVRQFIGINGKINLEKMMFLIEQIKFCKKFHLVTMSNAKKNKLIKVIQVTQMLAVEKSVISNMAEQVRNSKIFDKVLKKFIC